MAECAGAGAGVSGAPNLPAKRYRYAVVPHPAFPLPPPDFDWGEPGDLMWEARDAGWGNEIVRAYERGLADAAALRAEAERLRARVAELEGRG